MGCDALGVAFHESRFDSNAGSPTGVRGVMQLTQRTARSLGYDRNINEQNIQGGMQALRNAVDRCGSTDYACLARNYNGSTPAQQAAWAQGVRQAVTYFNGAGRP